MCGKICFWKRILKLVRIGFDSTFNQRAKAICLIFTGLVAYSIALYNVPLAVCIVASKVYYGFKLLSLISFATMCAGWVMLFGALGLD